MLPMIEHHESERHLISIYQKVIQYETDFICIKSKKTVQLYFETYFDSVIKV